MKATKDWKRDYLTKPRRVEAGKKASKPSKKSSKKADEKADEKSE